MDPYYQWVPVVILFGFTCVIAMMGAMVRIVAAALEERHHE